ncbi:MAG: hypothetical protein HRU78_07880 [Gammaproteobacteria bacterium]|nr:MAG: hypothetical protein HRU78_07880 [Gammaproteobacteria bacterium]
MEIKKYIEMGEEKAGSQKNLADYLETRYTTLGLVKSGKKSLTAALCIKLARFIGEDELKVIAASYLVVEKDEKRRKIFESCFTKAATVAAAALIFGGSSMTSSPAHAAMSENGSVNNLYYVK